MSTETVLGIALLLSVALNARLIQVVISYRRDVAQLEKNIDQTLVSIRSGRMGYTPPPTAADRDWRSNMPTGGTAQSPIELHAHILPDPDKQ